MDLIRFLKQINHSLTFFVVFPCILFFGSYLTYRLRLIQFTKLTSAFRQLLHKNDSAPGNMSHYQAIAAVLAGNFGTGNISGMAIALSMGGPGALVWMWIMAFLGSAIQYASCILGVRYRTKNANQEYVGGPMYYLTSGLGWKTMAKAFALATLFAAFTVGNFAQVNSLALPLAKLGVPSILAGLVIALLTGLVVLGGAERFAKIASSIVPIMALFYFTACLFILGQYAEKIIPAVALMFRAAFSLPSVAGGALGFGVFQAVSTGFDRGLFATDAGTGIIPIMQAGARSKHPVLDGVVTLVAPLCVMIVCTTTALVLLVTGVWNEPGLRSTVMVTEAFSRGIGPGIGPLIVLVSLFLFSYTTLLAWCYCGERAYSYLYGTHNARKFQWCYILLVPIGGLIPVDLVWTLADLCISLMLITNLSGIVALSSSVIEESRVYFKQFRI